MTSPPNLTQIQERLQREERYWGLKVAAKEQVLRSRGHARIGDALECVLDDAGSNTISNVAYSVQQSLPGALSVGPPSEAGSGQGEAYGNYIAAEVLASAQIQWQALILERLHAAQLVLPSMPLAAAPRSEEELVQLRDTVADLEEPWECIGSRNSPFTNYSDASSLSKLLYDAADVLDMVTTPLAPSQPRRPQYSSDVQGSQVPKLSLVRAVQAPKRAWLQSFFADLKVDKRQMGIDDVLHPWFKDEQVHEVRHMLSAQSAAACRAAARCGVPPSERPSVWAGALGLKLGTGVSSSTGAGPLAAAAGVGDWEEAEVASPCGRTQATLSARDEDALALLCEAVERQQLLVDTLVWADAQNVADSEHYFVFEETLRAVMLAFSRDLAISRCAARPAGPRLAAENSEGKLLHPYPPSGVLPFRGLCAYAAPLCYLYEHPAMVYQVFSAMYCRYWCGLHNLNIRPAPAAGLSVLCRTFEDLLQECDPEVEAHLCSLEHSALAVCFPWMFSAFVGFLSPSETLVLWDRIIGFDSLLVLPVLAVAIVSFRRDMILAARSADELIEVTEDLTQLRVVPLLQAVLFDT